MKNSCLLVIDVQQGIDDTKHWGGNRNNPDAERNISTLLDKWRRLELPVVIVRHDSTDRKSPFFPGKAGNELKHLVAPLAGELVLSKSTTNAFVGTTLNNYLLSGNISHIVVTGFVTNNSIEATSRHAGDLGYRVTVVSDATACFDKIGLDGATYPSALIHQISLSNLAGEYALIQLTSDVINLIETHSIS